jgi:hypothetical protein
MPFILNAAGVPSVASFVRVHRAPIAAPTHHRASSNVTVAAGQSVVLQAAAAIPERSDGYPAWTFPGGSPRTSAVRPGNVTYSTPGSYVASFRVTDNGGLTVRQRRARSRFPTSR